ncbi:MULTISPECIES: hypothetical protein [Actinomycetes]|uniref:hypothetical protein n=1 Tax=Actinomycetes TaxID=1760 RepID=UPI0001B54666|nr:MULTISPECIES: hypothetical protein [Actinomycetes]EFL11761.1 predicted protein [Streptomyces sp. AA4]
MNHPPQGPYPQQGPFPPRGPQQGPPPGQFGQYPQPSKKKSKAGLWISLGTAVVVLGGAVAFTGWVTPGFFKEKLDTTSRGTPEQLAQSVANSITEQTGLNDLWCKIRSKRSYAAEEMFRGAKGDAKISNPVHPTGPQERAATITASNLAFGIALIPDGTGWCVRDVKADGEPAPLASLSTDPKPRPPMKDGTDAATKFIDAVNARDIPAALSVMCRDAPDTTRDGTQQWIYGETKLTVRKTDVLRTAGRTIVHVDAKLDGVAKEGRVETDDRAVDGACVTSFDPTSD